MLLFFPNNFQFCAVKKNYIVYEDMRSYKQSVNIALGAVKLTRNADKDDYGHTGYGIGFDARAKFSSSGGAGFGENIFSLGDNL